ncbi:MAG: YcxB family protein [Nitrospinales bacterium]
MEIKIKLEKNDWKTFNAYVAAENKNIIWRGNRSLYYLYVALVAVVTFIFVYKYSIDTSTAMALIAIFVLASLYNKNYTSKLFKLYEPSDDGWFLGKHKFSFDEEGIKTQGDGSSSFQSWSTVKKIVCGHGMIMIFIDTANAFIFPAAKLNNPEEFYNHINNLYTNTSHN